MRARRCQLPVPASLVFQPPPFDARKSFGRLPAGLAPRRGPAEASTRRTISNGLARPMQDLLITSFSLLAACTFAAVVAAILRMPTLTGYLAVGALLGPSAAGILIPGGALDFLSELGVALLLFLVGLEFSLGHFWLIRKTVLTAGALQMVVVAAPLALGLTWLGLPARDASLLGVAAAMSSTALVSRQLADQGELTTRHGRSAIAVLVFQDLAAVPLLAIMAIWARGGDPKFENVLIEVLAVLALFVVCALGSRRLLHGLLRWVASRDHEESFVLCSLCVVVASAAGAHAIGVSAALGAFLAGIVLGESDFRHRMEKHLRPFRDVLSGVFFVGIGSRLDFAQVVTTPGATMAWLLALVPIKIILNTLALRATRMSALDAWRTGILLGHGGEFALLLLGIVLQQGLIAASVVQPMLLALVLSMALAPLLIRMHDMLALLLSRSRGLKPPPQAEEGAIATTAKSLRNHVIICGAGELGRDLSRILTQAGISHLLLESDDEEVAAARATGAPVHHGDASRPETLQAAGLEDACLVVLTFARISPARRIIKIVHRFRPTLDLVVTCSRENEISALNAFPNVYLYRESFAAAIGIARQIMLHLGKADDLAVRSSLDQPPFPTAV